MSKCPMRLAAVWFALVAGLAPSAGLAEDIDLVIALPSPTLTFSAAFLAEDAGFYKKEGLKVSHRFIVGVGSINAVIAGSADFTIGTGPVFLRAASQGQRMLAIANLIDRPLVEMVLRKDVAQTLGITDAMSFADRARKLKGKTIAIQGVGSIIHAWERLVVNRGGLDVENDVRIAPMDPPAMLPALETKAIDGFATSLPFTTQAVVKGTAVNFASGVHDAPDLLPFAYGLVYTKPQTCAANRDKCIRVVRALAASNKFIKEKPAEALDILRKRFAKMDADVLEAAWKDVAKAHAENLQVAVAALDNSQKVSLEAKLLEKKDALPSFDGLFTDEYLK